MSTLNNLLAVADEGPWCGTKPPGTHVPRPRPAEEARHALLRGPQPDPWSEVRGPLPDPWLETRAVFWQSIRLAQAGERLKEVASRNEAAVQLSDAISGAAEQLFDEYCGTIPKSLLVWWLIHNPPPPPPWENRLVNAVDTYEVGIRLGGEMASRLQETAATIIRETLPAQAQKTAENR